MRCAYLRTGRRRFRSPAPSPPRPIGARAPPSGGSATSRTRKPQHLPSRTAARIRCRYAFAYACIDRLTSQSITDPAGPADGRAAHQIGRLPAGPPSARHRLADADATPVRLAGQPARAPGRPAVERRLQPAAEPFELARIQLLERGLLDGGEAARQPLGTPTPLSSSAGLWTPAGSVAHGRPAPSCCPGRRRYRREGITPRGRRQRLRVGPPDRVPGPHCRRRQRRPHRTRRCRYGGT